MPGKYSRETILEYVAKAFAQEVELVAEFNALKVAKNITSEYAICVHVTPPIPLRLLQRDSIVGVGVGALKTIRKNMVEIQHLIARIENNETETELAFRTLIEEMKL